MHDRSPEKSVAADLDRGGGIISLLEEVQAEYGYLPAHELQRVATLTGRSLVDIYGVATFFRAFSLTPRGKHHVQVCLGTACHVRGGPTIANEVQRQLGIRPGETTPDRSFSLETVNCLGACALGPVMVVDGHYFSKVRVPMTKGILEKAAKGFDVTDIQSDKRIFPLQVACTRCSQSLMDAQHPIDGHPSIRLTVSAGNRYGWALLSSLYGSHTTATELEIPEGTVTEFYCPHCHSQLGPGSGCVECGAAMIPLMVGGGGVVQVCSRRGCKGHILDFGGATLG